MTPLKLEIVQLRHGLRIVRPEGAVGTTGWSPKAWQASPILAGELPLDAFLDANPNFELEEITL